MTGGWQIRLYHKHCFSAGRTLCTICLDHGVHPAQYDGSDKGTPFDVCQGPQIRVEANERKFCTSQPECDWAEHPWSAHASVSLL